MVGRTTVASLLKQFSLCSSLFTLHSSLIFHTYIYNRTQTVSISLSDQPPAKHKARRKKPLPRKPLNRTIG
ncbi:hypothetical protein L1887_39083 [Cichorium endivia]|nr:hypothetical protein L1887_39083 [Cichorium endivia]